MRKQVLSLSLVAGLALFTFASCGGDTTDSEQSTATEETMDSGAELEILEIEIQGGDDMKFDKTQLHAKAGQTVRLTLVHTGEMSKDAMGHNFVLLQEGSDVAEFGTAASSEQANDYIPTSKSSEIIAHTDLIGGGESTTIEFVAPEAGRYPFLCSFPGHFGLMKGLFIVE